MGYIIFGLGSQSVLGITGGTLMWIPHAIGETILFLMAGALIMRTGTRRISNLGGLARKMPYTATITMIGILTLIGVPPTSGFMAEWILFNGALQTGTENMDSFRIVLFSLAIFSTILNASYLLNMYRKIFFGPILSKYEKLVDVSRYAIIPMVFIGALSLFLGVYPDPMINPVIGYAENIFSNIPTIYSFPFVHDNINNNLNPTTFDLKDGNEMLSFDNYHYITDIGNSMNKPNLLEIH
jgi:NADH-quinone oxidoreductase subunit M